MGRSSVRIALLASMTAVACAADESSGPSHAGGGGAGGVGGGLVTGGSWASGGSSGGGAGAAGTGGGACVPKSCAEANLSCGKAPDDGCGNPLDCGPCCSNTCTKLVDDDLTDGNTDAAQEGGAFVAGGWQTVALENRLVYDLGKPVPCGRFEIVAKNLDPTKQVVDKNGKQCPYDGCQGEGGTAPGKWCECDAMPIGLFESPHGSMHKAAAACESWAHLRVYGYLPDVPGFWDAAKLDSHVKLKAGALGYGGGFDKQSPAVFGWDLDAVMTFKVHWESNSFQLEVLKGAQSLWNVTEPLLWPGEPGFEANPAKCSGPKHAAPFRYLFVGRDHFVYPAAPVGAIYQRVTVYDCSAS